MAHNARPGPWNHILFVGAQMTLPGMILHEATYEPAEVTMSQTVVTETLLPVTSVEMRLWSPEKGEKQPAMR